MGTITHLLGRMGTILTTTAITVGLAAGLAAAPASAATVPSGARITPAGANLTLTPIGGTTSQYKVRISGTFPMQQADAQGYINNMGTVGGMFYRLRADDVGADRVIGANRFYRGVAANNSGSNILQATPGGLLFQDVIVLNRDIGFNEDDGPFDYTDEIYGEAEFVDGDNGRRLAKTQVLSGHF